MPATLAGRQLHLLGTGDGLHKLDDLRYHGHDGDWLLGGQELALRALALTVIDATPTHDQRVHAVRPAYGPLIQEVHLCRSDRCAFPQDRRYFDRITPVLRAGGLEPAMSTRFGDVTHEVWRVERPLV